MKNDKDENGDLGEDLLAANSAYTNVLGSTEQGGKRTQFFQSGFADEVPEEVSASSDVGATQTAGDKIVKINLAWFVVFGGLFIAYFGIGKLRKRLLPQQSASRK